MLLFNFPFHTFSVVYPATGKVVQLGRGWESAVAPDGPFQKQFKLTFDGMQWFTTVNGDIDFQTTPERNMGALLKFYELHLLHEKFYYDTEVYGLRIVRFAQPLNVPTTIRGGTGVVQPFDIQFRDIP